MKKNTKSHKEMFRITNYIVCNGEEEKSWIFPTANSNNHNRNKYIKYEQKKMNRSSSSFESATRDIYTQLNELMVFVVKNNEIAFALGEHQLDFGF